MDIRQIICYTETIFRANNKTITMSTIEKQMDHTKDSSLMINHNEATRKLVNRFAFSKMTMDQRIDLGFVDSDMVPLMVH